MKYRFIIIAMSVLCFQSYGQEKDEFFFDEFGVSVNRTALKDENTEDRFGFGLGLYHSLMGERRINLTFGFEYNRVSQFKRKMNEGHFTYSTDLTYNTNNLSIPFNIRLNIGSRTKVLIEAGAFVDLIQSSRRRGTLHSYAPDQNGNMVRKESDIDGKTSLASINYGFAIGLGIRIPFDRFELVIRPDYRLGLRELYSDQNSIRNSYMRLTFGLKRK